MGDVYGELVLYSVVCVTLPLHTLVQSSLAIKITRYKDLSSIKTVCFWFQTSHFIVFVLSY